MPLSLHTVLINCVIGFCQKDSETWIHPLADLGYETSLLEQKIPLTGGQEVKPDVVAHSNSLNHSLVVDCKGGTTVKEGQMERYGLLSKNELKNYIYIYDLNQFTHDTCIVDFEQHHGELAKLIQGFPFLTITATQLRKSGTFTKGKLDAAFATGIAIPAGMVEPSSYYPFSENDGQGVVVKEVLRAFIAILQDKRKRNLNVFARETYADADVLKIIHPMYPIMGRDHQDAVVGRILDIIAYLQKEYSEFARQVFDIQNARFEGVDIHVRIANLIEACQQIAEKEDEKLGLEPYMQEETPKR